MSEFEIQQKLKERDTSAIEYLFDTYYEPLYLFCENFIYNSDAAHDLVQNVFIKLWENSAKIEFSHSIKSYLFGAVKNESLQYLRALKIRDSHNKKWALAHIESMTLQYIPTPDPHQLITHVRELIKELPPQCQAIYSYRLENNYKYSQIADIMGISESVVKVQMHRATKKIRELLGTLPNFTPRL